MGRIGVRGALGQWAVLSCSCVEALSALNSGGGVWDGWRAHSGAAWHRREWGQAVLVLLLLLVLLVNSEPY